MSSMEMMRTYLDHITAGEFEAAMEYWADDIVCHVSGNNVTSGIYRGREGGAEYATKAIGSVDSFRIEEHDLLISDRHAVVLSTGHLERNGKQRDSNTVTVYHTDGDKITEFWIIPEDQKGADEFLS